MCFFPLLQWNSADRLDHDLYLRALDNRYQTTLFPMLLFVRDHGVEFSSRNLDFIDV